MLWAAAGDDGLRGSAGGDTLVAGSGTDTCDGGLDLDVDLTDGQCETETNLP